MGLDNIPAEYPCIVRGLAVYVDVVDENGVVKTHEHDGLPIQQHSCNATQEAGRCPILLDTTRPTEGAVTGIFGTDCWYRGKWGYVVAAELDVDASDLYGREDTARLDEDGCFALAEDIAEALEERLAETGAFKNDEGDDLEPDARYLIWWLRYVATEAGGMRAWY